MKNNQEYLDNLRHSAAHLLAAAVMKLWPKTKRAIGPSIEDGFYFDFEFPPGFRLDEKGETRPSSMDGEQPISEKDFPKIEKAMHEIVKSWDGFEHHELSKEAAKKEYPSNPFKHELIDEFSGKGEKLSFYKSGNYWDLCRGGHIENPKKELQYFKLLSVAGAYWRGSEKNPMLTRIYATAFPTKEELDEYLKMQEEAKKRDHRKLGKALDLFTFSDLVGSGFPLYTPRGSFIRRTLTQFIEDLQAAEGYQQVWTPQVGKAELFKTSGHYDKYKQDMFKVISNYSKEEMYLKPMNCPQHTQIYASKPRSYKDLPIRYTDFSMLYRDEKPGELSGLARTRSFSQDDCHVFCREDQIDEEIDRALTMIKKAMNIFGFKYRYRLSTRDKNHPENYLGDPKTWDKVEKWAENIMKRNNIDYIEAPGEASFYAPKMDLLATDALGREWQLSTVQIDYVQPQRFGLIYIDKDGKEKHPVIIHRAIIGSAERFMMILLEHTGGALPTWLSPVQVKVLPISEKQNKYAQSVFEELRENNIRLELDDRNESVGKKIREAEMEKVPYMLIVGEKEVDAKSVSVRARNQKDLGAMKLDKFVKKINDEIKART